MLWPDFIIQIATVKGRLEYSSVLHLKVLQDILLNLRGSRGCQSDNGCGFTELRDDIADLAIFRPEIMSTLRNTMGLVHRNERESGQRGRGGGREGGGREGERRGVGE